MKASLTFFFVTSCLVLFSQEITVQFQPTLDGKPVQLNRNVTWNNDTILVENLRFYISHLTVSNESEHFSSEQPAFLFDAADNKTIVVPVSEGFIPTRVNFLFGTDSLMNCSGILDGDLDPALGMYWAWQSGYINFKLEGKATFFKEKDGEYAFHIGGYQGPFSTARTVELGTREKVIIVELPLDSIFKSLSENMTQIIMRPCAKGSELANFVAEQFRIVK